MTQFPLGTVVGSDGNGIASIEKTGTSGLVDTYTVTYDNGDTDTFEVTNGEDGSEVSVTQVLSSGTKLATITIDGTSTDLYCSSGGRADIVTSWESTLSDSKVPSEKLTKNTIDGKADSVHTHTKSQITDFPTLATVATSGSYSDLSNKPSIPSSSSDLSDGSDIIKKSNTSGLIKNDGTIDTTSYVSDVSGKEDTSNKVTSWSSTTTDTHYPSEKLTKDSLDGKQATLVSGTNIKTVNNESLLGSGNITIQGGGGADIVTSWESTLSDTKVPSEKLTKNSLDDKISKSNTTGLVKNDGTIDTTSYVSDVSGKADKTGWTASKNIVTDSSGALTTENKNNHNHGSLNSDGSLGSGSGLNGHIVVLDNNNKLSETSSINASKIKDSNAHSNIGTSANATQSQINTAIDSLIGSAITYIVGSGS